MRLSYATSYELIEEAQQDRTFCWKLEAYLEEKLKTKSRWYRLQRAFDIIFKIHNK